MFTSLFGKYRSIVVSIALFLILDASVLMLNFYISFQIADDAVAVNIAGRQRMLSQRMVKSIYEIEYAQNNPAALERASGELASTALLFNQTLLAFDQGGIIMGANQRQVEIQAATTLEAQTAIRKAKRLWSPLESNITALLHNIKQNLPLPTVIDNAIRQAQLSNLELLSLMNKLTVNLEFTATQKATRLRWIQTIGILLAVINFFIILVHFIGQLRDNDKQLDAARRETSDILNTVNEGLFLLDRQLIISHQHSAKLESLFGGRPVADQSFADLLRDLVCEKDMDTAQRFVNLLFRKDIRSNLIGDLNPLDKVEINIPDNDGGFNTRYLSFDFRRVIEQQNVSGVLVTVNDITENVLLARELEQTRAQNEQQLAMLTNILHTEPKMLKRFIQNAFDTFHRINFLLRDQQKNRPALHSKLNDIFIEIHTFKGDASAYQLEQFIELAHEYEQVVVDLKGKKELNGNDFLRLTVLLEKLFKHTEGVQTLTEKLAGFAPAAGLAATKQTVKHLTEWGHLFDLTQSIAKRTHKQAYLVMTGFTENNLDQSTQSLINDLCVQFIRNAVVHGLELPNVRKNLNKPESGRIDVRLCKLPEGQLELSVNDDGRGFDYNLIRRKALATGRWSASELNSWSHKKLLLMIFEPGFSTADRTTEDAGRGVGMDVVVNRIRRLRGHIRVASRTGKQCQFTVTLPNLSPTASQADAA